MRTLLTDPIPPQCPEGQTVGQVPDELAEKRPRTFRLAAVLASMDDLLEVGVDGTVIATPGAAPAE